MLQQDWAPSATRQTNLRRRRVFAVTLIAALAITLSFTWLRPAEYRASARVEINPAVEAPPSLPSAASTSVVVAAPPASEPVRPFLTEIQVLTSRPIIERAIAQLERAGEKVPPGDQDSVASVQSRLEAVPASGTNVVELSAVGPSPRSVANLVNAIIDVYRAQLADAYRNASSEAFAQVNDEVEKLEQALAVKRRDVEAFRIRHNIISLERQENEALAQMRNLSASLSSANERVAMAEGKLRALREAAAAGKLSAKDDPTLAQLETRAADMREQLGEMERGFTQLYLANEPKVVALRARLAALERDIAAQRVAGPKMAVAKAEDEFATAQAALAQIQSQVAAGRQEASRFTTQFNEYKLQQASLNDLEGAYRDALQRRARLEASARARMPTLGVVEPATPPQEPWRPLYYRDSAIAVGASLLLALLTMGLGELFNRAEDTPAVVVMQPQPAGGAYAGLPGQFGPQRLHLLPPKGAPPLLADHDAPPLLAVQPALPRELRPEEIAALLAASDIETRRVVLLLLSGLSVDEAAALRWADIDVAAQRLRVGGASRREIVAGSALAAVLGAAAPGHPGDAPVIDIGRDATRESVDARILCAAHDAGVERASEVTGECIRHTYVAFLVRSRLRFADLVRIVGQLPTDVLRAYSALSPAGERLSLAAVDLVYPALRAPAAERP